MIHNSVGIDIEEIARFRRKPYLRNKKFYEQIFTAREIKYCLSKKDPYPHFTARFAAKEAVTKALGSTIYHAKQIEIINDKNGKPLVKEPILRTNYRVLISLSHSGDNAVAVAILTL